MRISWKNAALVTASLVSAGLLLLATGHGEVIITPDGVSYIAAARSFASGSGFQDFSGSPFTFWTPLYPVVLAGVGALSPNLLEGVRWLNMLTLAATALAAGLLLLRALNTAGLVLLGLALVAFSRPHLTNATQAISEPLFTLLVLLFLLVLSEALQRQTWANVLRLALIAGLAGLQRYMGVTVIITGVVCLLLLFHQTPLRQRFAYAAVFGGLAFAPLAVWFARNLALTGALVRDTAGTGTPLPENVTLTHNTLIGWLAPEAIVNALPPLIGVGLLLALAVGFIVGGVRGRGQRAAALAVIAVFFVVYVAALLLLTTRPGYGPIGSRLLTPVYVPLMILLLAGIEQVMSRVLRVQILPLTPSPSPTGGEGSRAVSNAPFTGRQNLRPTTARHDHQQERTRQDSSPQMGKWVPIITLVILGVALLPHPLSRAWEQVETLDSWCCAAERGYDNPLTEWLRTHELAGRVVTNMPLPLYYTRRTMTFAPLELADWADTRAAYLVWFGEPLADACSPERFCARQNYTLDDLRGILPLELIFESADGGVYRIGD